ncbi:RNA polymerase factor sigma-32 [Cellvibrio sp. BR]|jgi:RNA polymerase sigma-32 factor|uniref:RNA polymerase sigma factor RpoH n=1 Tax=unclassified Cellvibrio TaxID=2624793 RepID=UPI00026010BA|nr:MULTISPECIES: RNA polymerase sigma factor RpoH [unclassified Cellvibrio]EIK46625.1 RNA polymerase factor sigma-32 [Cellvibrio sp. BR]QEY11360.1 RNA polymerase sigma factor RpoH [Cellvibrio sp. KY-YJ-3]UUA71476.1 RNA polymerase sigma factor RpoH [Cellvibrio sp. QJXJ]
MSASTSLQPIGILAPGANLNAYVQAVSAFSILTVEEEQELARDLHHNGNLDAARKLVMAHLRFVVHIARSYNGYGLPLGDLVQEGNVGLMKAVKRFDPDKGVRLVSFAVHWIKAEIHEFILKNWRIVKIATTKAQRKLFFNLRGAKKRLAWLSNDEAHAVAADLGVDVKQVREMEGRLASYDAGFDAGEDDEDDGYVAPAHYLEDNRYDPAVRLEESNWEESNVNSLEKAIEQLDDRSRVILQRRWLNEDKATLHDLAAEYGVSAERIRQLEKNAMNKVKTMMLEA